ncbi:putative RING finger protein [Neolecta irregularis DAH-3]|uniref:Putative RING finger protein n=1 Tax=Neolecta irregularis (strain DAH-3) TaxID=1198029 RepID=A0A1U7LTR1_NEOID|nr:putative RING finger protein [Neolecta irregularis DAH-3]|eukprot:OLL26065.1 putative RING finger protein [Neolecta irregularis DAH-3]
MSSKLNQQRLSSPAPISNICVAATVEPLISRQVNAPSKSQSNRPSHKDRKRPSKPQFDATSFNFANRRGQVSLNHLLNFSYTPRETPTNIRTFNHRRSFGVASGRHPTDKAKYIHANYRFVVSAFGDYRAQSVDSDVPIPWNNILQVIASVETQCTNCPICLTDVPIAPRIAKCGHVFCLPCIIRYLAEKNPSDSRFRKWKKCPICWDSVYIEEMKPIKWIQADDSNIPRVNTDVSLRLMRREQGSTLILPRDNTNAFLTDGEIPWYYFSDVINYARIMKGNQEYMKTESRREIVELEDLESRDTAEFGKDGDWNDRAIEQVLDWMPPTEEREPPSSTQNKKKKQKPTEVATVPAPVNTYYFYQPRSASHFYLSPLDVRILKTQFGSFSQFPNNLLVQIEAIQYDHTIDDDIRKRMKYLAHLPRGCEISFLECNWEGIVSDSILKYFRTEIEARRKKRQDKEQREDRARIQAEKSDWEKFPGRKSDFLPENSYILDDFSAFPVTSSPSKLSVPTLDPSDIKRTVWGTISNAKNESDILPQEESFVEGWSENWELELENLDVKRGKKKLVLLSNAARRQR